MTRPTWWGIVKGAHAGPVAHTVTVSRAGRNGTVTATTRPVPPVADPQVIPITRARTTARERVAR